jgi:arylsulfatase A
MSQVNRREFCSGLAALSAVSNLPALAQTSDARKPNIVFVICDDLGSGDLGCYNSRTAIPTPNANRLASQGVRWTDMHSSDANCTPSRYSVLTGRYCWRTRLQKASLEGDSPALIEPGRMTVASMLKSEGYYTAGVGKWHLGLGDEPKTDYSKTFHPCPVDLGFDYYYGIPASADMPPYLYFENDHAVEQPTSSTPGRSEQQRRGVFWREGPMAPHFDWAQLLPNLTNKAVDIVKERAAKPSQPFFLYFALPSPHTPWMPLPEYKGKSRAGDYGDYVVEVDDMLGKVMAAVKEGGIEDNTLFIFTSDHGADWRLEDMCQYEHRGNAYWRGQKADIWDGGHRIPFIARWPGHIPAASVVGHLAGSIDFMATAAAIVGTKLPLDAAEDSFNQLAPLLGQHQTPIRGSVVYHSWGGMFGIQEGNWKLALGLGSGGWYSKPEQIDPGPRGPKGQLYNLATDPYEFDNVYEENPEVVARLTKLLETIQRQGYSRPS